MRCGQDEQQHTQCLYQRTSPTEEGFQCAGGGVVNDILIIDLNNKNYHYLEDLAESVQNGSLGAYRPGAHPAPYFLCEQYCSNDPTCFGFVPDFEYGQRKHHCFKGPKEDEKDVEFEEVRCVIARGETPTSVSTDAFATTDGTLLDIMAPCYVKDPSMCIDPLTQAARQGEENATLATSDMCGVCSSLMSSNGKHQCFWCEPSSLFSMFGGDDDMYKPVGKCICTAELILGEESVLDSKTKGNVCESVFEQWYGAAPVAATAMSVTTADGNTTRTEYSCAASLETLQMEHEQMAAGAQKMLPFVVFFGVDLFVGFIVVLGFVFYKCCYESRSISHATGNDLETVATAKDQEQDNIGTLVMGDLSGLERQKHAQTAVPAFV